MAWYNGIIILAGMSVRDPSIRTGSIDEVLADLFGPIIHHPLTLGLFLLLLLAPRNRSKARNPEGYATVKPANFPAHLGGLKHGLDTDDVRITYNARERTLRRLTKHAYADGFDLPRGELLV